MLCFSALDTFFNAGVFGLYRNYAIYEANGSDNIINNLYPMCFIIEISVLQIKILIL